MRVDNTSANYNYKNPVKNNNNNNKQILIPEIREKAEVYP